MTSLLEERISMTLEEFLALPERDEHGNHFELDEGELVIVSPVGRPHGRRVARISHYLIDLLGEDCYEVVAGETGILMAIDPKPIIRGMDIAVLRLSGESESGMVRVAPLLIVEVISPSNDPVDLEKKRRQYQKFGVSETWFVYEDTKTIHVCRGTDSTIDVYAWPNEFYCRSLELTIDTRELFR